MAIIPLQTGRVSNALRMNVAQRSLTRTQQSLLEAQNQLSTGKRLAAPSDDTGAASLAMQLRKLLETRDSYAANLQHATSTLSEVDSSLGDLSDLLRQAQGIASANVSSIVSPEERSAAATAITSILNQALSLGNRQFEDMYLFGGDRSTQPPFVSDLGGVRFAGSSNLLQNTFDQSTVLPFMADGGQVFGAYSQAIGGSDLAPMLTAETRLADLNGAGGTGVYRGSILLSNGSESKVIDLSKAETVGDVLNAINAAGLGEIGAALGADGRSIVLTAGAGDNIAVTELGGTTAADLGILTTPAGGMGLSVNGQDLGPKLTGLTRIADLRGGAGIDAASGLILTNGVKSVTVDFSSANTVEDILNAINSAGVGAVARINSAGTGIEVLNSVQGLSLSIAENGGTTAADLGLRSFSSSTALSQLNGGQGVRTVAGDDLQILRRDGSSFGVDLSAAQTVQDVIDAINAADGGLGVTASFSDTGNGIVLTDTTGGSGMLRVQSLNGSGARTDLGLDGIAAGDSLVGRDVGGAEATGLFANLARLRDALIHNDQTQITTAAEALGGDLDRVVRVRGQVGAQVQEFESRQRRLEDQNVATEALLSNLEDVDYNEAVTRFQTLQTALQASLQTTGRLLNLSLLDFLG